MPGKFEPPAHIAVEFHHAKCKGVIGPMMMEEHKVWLSLLEFNIRTGRLKDPYGVFYALYDVVFLNKRQLQTVLAMNHVSNADPVLFCLVMPT